MTVRLRTGATATVLFLVVVAEAVAAAVAVTTVGLDFFDIRDSELTISNTVIGLSLAGAGWLIGRHRPEHPLGWLLLAGGVAYTTSGAGFALIVAGAPHGSDSIGWRLLATLTNGGWPWAITLFLPLVLLLFPDGRPLSPRWRWVVALTCANAIAFAAVAVLPTRTLTVVLGVPGYPNWRWFDNALPALGAITTIAGSAIYVVAIGSLAFRYRRGDERTRRQLLWLLLGTGIMVTGFVISDVLGFDSLLVLFPITLVPLSIAIAVLRYQLLDIRLVVSRSVLYLLLTVGVIAAYAAIVATFDAMLRNEIGVGTSVLATLVIAVVFNPVRIWLQRLVDRAFYGARKDPVRAIAEVGARLGDVASNTSTGLEGVLEALCHVMRLPSATIAVNGTEVATYGTAPQLRQSLPLRQGGDAVGELTVGLRPGESRLAPPDEKVLLLLSTSLAVAVHATSLATQLSNTRDALVTTREEERRRLQRDLHDGLGPALTAVVLKADAARRLATSDPEQAAKLMGELRAETTTTIEGVRRLVNELRPPSLDGLGLVGALREQAATFTRLADGSPLRVSVEAEEPLAVLHAAVEVAAYRIATEALTNVTRHSTATAAVVSLNTDGGTLTMQIRDDGASGRLWRPGLGLTSMQERAAELGGVCESGPDGTGGLVTLRIPIGGAE